MTMRIQRKFGLLESPDSKRRPRTTLSKAEYEELSDFRHALRQFLHFSEQAANRVGVTPQQHQALLAIKGFRGRDSVTVRELADRLQIEHHSAVGLVNRLALDRLVKRKTSAIDGRQVMVGLTRRGESVLVNLSEAHHEELQRIAPQLAEILSGFNAK